MNEERDFDNMLFDLKHEAQGPQRKKELQVLHGPTMSGIGGDPRIRKMTSPRKMDSYSFKYMVKAHVAAEEWFEQSGELDEALWKATDEAEKVYMEVGSLAMDAETWRVSDEAEHNSKERHPSPSLLLSSTLTLTYLHLTLTITLTSLSPHHTYTFSGARGFAQGHSRED